MSSKLSVSRLRERVLKFQRDGPIISDIFGLPRFFPAENRTREHGLGTMKSLMSPWQH